MKPYVHGQSPTAQLEKATTRVNFLEHQVARLRTVKPIRPEVWPPFDSPAFLEEYERERAWAARQWPEQAETKATRLAILVAEIYQPSRRLAA